VAHFYIFFTVVTAVISQLLIKWRVGVLSQDVQLIWFEVIGKLLLDLVVWLAIALSFLSGLFWMMALRHFAVSYAYPWTAAVYVAVVVGGAVIFDERVNLGQIVGLAMICSGIWISARS
jgi:multidrug transporter EmrE-like cation transporter